MSSTLYSAKSSKFLSLKFLFTYALCARVAEHPTNIERFESANPVRGRDADAPVDQFEVQPGGHVQETNVKEKPTYRENSARGGSSTRDKTVSGVDYQDNFAKLSAIPREVSIQLSKDPLAMTSSVLVLLYLIGYVLLKPSKTTTQPKSEPEIDSSPFRPTKRLVLRKPPKSAVAVAINQQLTSLHTPAEVLECALSYKGQMDIVNVVTAVHRSTKLALAQRKKNLAQDSRVHELLEHLHTFFEEDMPVHILSRAVGNTAWALAKLHYKEDERAVSSILETLQHNFTEFAEHFKPEELMNTVWAFAEMSRDTKEGEARVLAVAQAACRCVKRFPSFTLQQVVYFAWAVARLSSNHAIRSDPKVHAGLAVFNGLIVERVSAGMDSLTTKNLAMISWAIAHLQKVKSSTEIAPLLLAVVREAEKRGYESFHPGELASIIWALSKCQVAAPEFFGNFQAYIMRKGFRGFSSQDLANVVCAFVNAGMGDDTFFIQLGAQVQKTASQFNKLEKTMVNWAYTQLPQISAPRIGS